MNKLSIIATTCCVLLTGCGGEKTETTSQATKQETTTTTDSNIPTYRVATLLAYPPFVQDNAKGGVEGFDIDVINHIADIKGFKVVYQPQSIWHGILEGLDEGKHDITAGGVFATPERQAKYDFSNPYMTTNWMLVLKDDSASGKAKYTSFDEALKKSKTFTAEIGSPSHTTLKNLVQGRQDSNIVDAKTPFIQITDVLQGKAEASYDNQRVYEYYIHKLSNDPHTKLYGFVDPSNPASQHAFAVKKGNTALVKTLNEGLAEMQSNGKFQELQKKWFGHAF